MRSFLSLAFALAILLVGMIGFDYAWAEPAVSERANAVSWPDWIRAIWPILVVVIGAIGTGLYLGLAVRFPTVAAFQQLKNRVDTMERETSDIGSRVKRVEELCIAAPTRVELQEDIAELGERLSSMEGEMKGVATQLGTTNRYLHTLIERGLGSR